MDAEIFEDCDTRFVAKGNDPQLVLETISQYVHEQGLSDRRVTVDELFAPSTLDL